MMPMQPATRIQVLKTVLARPAYFLFALVTATAVFAFTVWLPNLSLISHELGDGGVPLILRLRLPIDLLGGIATNFTAFSAVVAIIVSILFGMNATFLAYYFSRRVATAKSMGIMTGVGGMVSGIFGIGCAACGSVLATAGLSLVGASGTLTLLPLRGGEFGIIGIGLLLYSIAATAKQIIAPNVCDLRKGQQSVT